MKSGNRKKRDEKLKRQFSRQISMIAQEQDEEKKMLMDFAAEIDIQKYDIFKPLFSGLRKHSRASL